MKIKVKIYQEDALRKGKDAYGDLEIDIDPAALTQAQRDYLLLATRDLYDRLVMQGCGEATPEALISYLDYAIAEKTAKEVKEKSEHETEVARCSALSGNYSWSAGYKRSEGVLSLLKRIFYSAPSS